MKTRETFRNLALFMCTICIIINGITLPMFLYDRSLKQTVPWFENHNVVEMLRNRFETFQPVIDHKNLFNSYNQENPPVFQLKNDTREYIRKLGDLRCLIEGTNWTTMALNNSICHCYDEWFGPHCSYPFLLKFSDFDDYEDLELRDNPRRLINGLIFNIELDILEMRLEEMAVADVFMITESNYTGHGDPKPMYLFNALKSGRYLKHHDKIIHVFLNYFLPAARKNGWLAEYLTRDVLGSIGLKNQINGLRDDDIFLLTDADEIISKEVLLFLKLHDGYPEPICMNLHKTNFGFFWRVGNGDWVMCGASTFGFIDQVMFNKVSWMRDPMEHVVSTLSSKLLQNYVKKGAYVKKWNMCPPGVFCGWHCSWCFHIEGIQKKLLSAINADFPRWGDYPEKTKLKYIKRLVTDGKWFDEKNSFVPLSPSFYMYAPTYVLQNEEKFKYLLQNPYRNMTELNSTAV